MKTFQEQLMNRDNKINAAQMTMPKIKEILEKIKENLSESKKLVMDSGNSEIEKIIATDEAQQEKQLESIEKKQVKRETPSANIGGKTLRKNKNRELINKAHKKKLKIW